MRVESDTSTPIKYASIPERATYFFWNSYNLESFPVFATYLVCILLIPLWSRLIKTPFNLKPVMVLYNIFCVILSVVAVGLLTYGTISTGEMYGFIQNYYLERGFMIYTVSKNVELLDTVFMVLRKKWAQISFLHVFHHSTILILGNYSWNYAPFPPVAIPLALNSLVHVFLYAYYAQTALSTAQRPGWKKMLTQFQILQFFFDLIFAIKGYLYHGFCIYALFYCTSMIILFSNFYYIAYIKKRKVAEKEK